MEEELVNTLRGTLEPDVNVIRAAQEHLQERLHPNPASGPALINIVNAGSSLPLAIRQAAAVNLSLWIKERWSPFFSEFKGFPMDDGSNVALPIEYKDAIRDALVRSCVLEESKLRGPMIKALVNVASCDWPDEFSSLLPAIQRYLSCHDGSSLGFVAIEGALTFLDDWFYTSMDETSLMSITREILPIIEKIVAEPQTYSVSIRCRCISIFNQMLETLWMVKEEYPEASKAVSAEIMPRWLDLLAAIVNVDVSTTLSNGLSRDSGEQLGLQSQAWSTISTATRFPTHMKAQLSKFLSIAMARLVTLQEAFERCHLISSTDVDERAGDSVPYATPASFAAKVIDFAGVALQNSASKSTANVETITTLIPLLQSYSRITAEEQEEWLENVSTFVAAGEEDEMGALNASMRARCADIFSELILTKKAETLNSIRDTVTAAHQKGKEMRARGVEGWWKEEESILALLGGIAEHLIESIEEAKELHQTLPLDLDYIYTLCVLPNMQSSTPFFLYGRCFVFASQFSSLLPADVAKDFLQAAVEAIESSADEDTEGSLIVKISAVRCLKNLHRHLSIQLLAPYSGRIMSKLGPLLSTASEDTLVLIVETLQAVAMQDASDVMQVNVTAEMFAQIVAESIQAWAREASDRILQSAVEDLLEAFAGYHDIDVATMVVRSTFVRCSDLLKAEKSADKDKYRSIVAVEGALEFAGAVSRGAGGEPLRKSEAVLPFLHTLFDTISCSDDREVHKTAAMLLTVLISKLHDQVFSFSGSNNVDSIQHILTLVSKMISPEDTSESGGLAVGDLLTTILRKAPEVIATTLPQLCTALASRLATSGSTLLVQSLVLPLAYLIKDHSETVIGLLNSQRIAIDQAQVTLLQILLRKWCDFASNFQGFWNTRVSTLGLCAMLRQAQIAHLNEMIVDGDLIPEDGNIIKTRSRAKLMPNRYTQIPVSAKIVKLLINEYTQSIDGPPSQSGRNGAVPDADDLEANEDDDDDEWDDDEDFAKKQRQDAFLSDMLGEDLDGGLDSLFAQHDEEQYKDDPLYNMPFRTFLSNYFRDLAQSSDMANRLGAHLTPREVEILRLAIL